MKRTFATIAITLLMTPLFAQTQSSGSKTVAVINGETITEAKLDQLYARLTPDVRAQYEKNGGKTAFLDNYIRKRLLVQEALKAGFDRKPDVIADVEAAKEGALFDRYVRDVVAQQVVSDADVRKYYDEHPSEFEEPEQVKVRHIVITGNGGGPKPKSKEAALEEIKNVLSELRKQSVVPAGTDPDGAARIRMAYFAEAARKYSEDGAAPNGGDLGWVAKGVLDPTFEATAFNMQPGVFSGIVETRFGYHIIFVDAKKAAGPAPFDEVKATVRDALMAQRAADIMEAVAKLTNELRATSKIAVYPENIH